MAYLVSTGTNVALVDLDPMTPQPRSNGIAYTRRTQAADGTVFQDAPFIELEFTVLETVTEYNTLLTQFGLNDSLTEFVTVYIPNEFYTFARYNGIVVRPEKGRDIERRDYYIRNVTLLVKSLELSTP